MLLFTSERGNSSVARGPASRKPDGDTLTMMALVARRNGSFPYGYRW